MEPTIVTSAEIASGEFLTDKCAINAPECQKPAQPLNTTTSLPRDQKKAGLKNILSDRHFPVRKLWFRLWPGIKYLLAVLGVILLLHLGSISVHTHQPFHFASTPVTNVLPEL